MDAANTDKLFTCLVDAEIVTESEVENAKSNMAENRVKASDIESVISELPTMKVAIAGWNHELKGIYVDYGGDMGSMTGAFTVNYDKAKNVSAPSDAKSVTKLINKVMTLMETFSTTTNSDVVLDCDDSVYGCDDFVYDYDD